MASIDQQYKRMKGEAGRLTGEEFRQNPELGKTAPGPTMLIEWGGSVLSNPTLYSVRLWFLAQEPQVSRHPASNRRRCSDLHRCDLGMEWRMMCMRGTLYKTYTTLEGARETCLQSAPSTRSKAFLKL